MVSTLIMCDSFWYFLFLFKPFFTPQIVFRIHSQLRPAVYKNDSVDKILKFCKKHFAREDGC